MANITIYANRDATAEGGAANTNNGSEQYLFAGENSSGQISEIFVGFDLSAIPINSAINSAYLRLNQYDSPNDWLSPTVTWRAQTPASEWSESTITYNNRPTSIHANSPQADVTFANVISSPGYIEFNVTAHVQRMVYPSSNGLYLPNNGFRLKYTGTSSSTMKYMRSREYGTQSQQPRLVIDYTPPTAPSAPTNPSQSPNAFESALRLSWAKGADGTNNPITGHDVRYQTSDDGSSWSAETSVNVSASATYYDIPSGTVSGWSRGKYVRFRVGSMSAYASTVYSGYSSAVRKNRAPNAPTGTPATNKSVYAPGETITVSFTPPSPRDPDSGLSGDIAGYEVKMQYPDGTDYNGGQIVGTNASGSATSVSVSTTGWTPGLQWKFLVRGYDSYGVRGGWSAATALVMIGTPLKVLVSGTLKSVAEQQVLVNGVLKQVGEIKVLVDGVLKNLTT